jgi:hypothetical protein
MRAECDLTRLQKLEMLAEETRSLIEFLGQNLGASDEWPLRIFYYQKDGETGRKFTQQLNILLRLLKELE